MSPCKRTLERENAARPVHRVRVEEMARGCGEEFGARRDEQAGTREAEGCWTTMEGSCRGCG